MIAAPQYRPTLVDPYREHLRKRRAEDPGVSQTQLLREIAALGYEGSANLLARYINQGRVEADHANLSAKKATGLLLADPTKLSEEQRSIRSLREGDSLVLERTEEEPGDWYIRVWRRPEGPFQLEYRDGPATEHYQTRTDSVERVVEAFFGWIERELAWKDLFEWIKIGDWFDHHADTKRADA